MNKKFTLKTTLFLTSFALGSIDHLSSAPWNESVYSAAHTAASYGPSSETLLAATVPAATFVASSAAVTFAPALAASAATYFALGTGAQLALSVAVPAALYAPAAYQWHTNVMRLVPESPSPTHLASAILSWSGMLTTTTCFNNAVGLNFSWMKMTGDSLGLGAQWGGEILMSSLPGMATLKSVLDYAQAWYDSTKKTLLGVMDYNFDTGGLSGEDLIIPSPDVTMPAVSIAPSANNLAQHALVIPQVTAEFSWSDNPLLHLQPDVLESSALKGPLSKISTDVFTCNSAVELTQEAAKTTTTGAIESVLQIENLSALPGILETPSQNILGNSVQVSGGLFDKVKNFSAKAPTSFQAEAPTNFPPFAPLNLLSTGFGHGALPTGSLAPSQPFMSLPKLKPQTTILSSGLLGSPRVSPQSAAKVFNLLKKVVK